MSEDQFATVTRMSAPTPKKAGSVARLSVVHPAELVWSCTLDAGVRTIGRSTTAEPGPLKHETVSRSHFELAFDAALGVHVGRDLGSHNGSRVDGHAVGSAAVPLRDQAVIQLGDVTLVLDQGPPPSPETAAPWPEVPGHSLAAAALRAALLRAAADPSPVLLVGETGTGKEFAARALHERSGRRGLSSINCAALSPQLIESQLFGHVRGAFTGATADSPGMLRAADGGTLFLDEIGELPLELQPKLLRALQEGEVQPVGSTKVVKVDVRVIAATNRDLEAAVEAGSFRRDLLARLSLWQVRLPPLRERRADLLAWIERLAAAWFARRGQPALPFALDPEIVEVLLLHRWTSNLRELDRLVHALAGDPALAAGERLGRGDLPAWLLGQSDEGAQPVAAAAEPKAAVPVPTREEFVAAHARLGGSVRALAKHFARDRRQIYRWLEAYGLRRDDEGGP
ncbi:MAG: sigma 54-interacting transcriptional regulator [Nannocystaceae bacterium]|nr:sigma 54-interacting transcriptional regulator [Nannocystaceae bacterium]